MAEEQVPEFATEEEAFNWLYEQVYDPCIDNDRIAYNGDETANREYDRKESTGCCGFADHEVVIDGRRARIGCNYGH